MLPTDAIVAMMERRTSLRTRFKGSSIPGPAAPTTSIILPPPPPPLDLLAAACWYWLWPVRAAAEDENSQLVKFIAIVSSFWWSLARIQSKPLLMLDSFIPDIHDDGPSDSAILYYYRQRSAQSLLWQQGNVRLFSLYTARSICFWTKKLKLGQQQSSLRIKEWKSVTGIDQ